MARRHDNGLKMLRRAENEMSRRKKKKNRGHKDVVGKHVQILALPKFLMAVQNYCAQTTKATKR
jgi:hypothetical protein